MILPDTQRIIAIDPGFSTGVVCLELDAQSKCTRDMVRDWTTIRAQRRIPSEIGKCEYIGMQLLSTLDKWALYTKRWELVIEGQQFWGASEISASAAARGNLFWLSFLTGYLVGLLKRYRQPPSWIHVLLPTDWKGQLPKDVVRRLLMPATPDAELSEHETDALGMAIHVLFGGIANREIGTWVK